MQKSTHSGIVRSSVIAVTVTVAVFVCDLVTKRIAFGYEHLSDVVIIPFVLGFLHHENRGIVANVPVPSWFIIGASCLIFFALLIAVFVLIRKDLSRQAIFVSLILGGAAGNLYDRIQFHFVRDWIWIFHWSVLNIADIAIFVGMLMLILPERKREEKGLRVLGIRRVEREDRV